MVFASYPCCGGRCKRSFVSGALVRHRCSHRCFELRQVRQIRGQLLPIRKLGRAIRPLGIQKIKDGFPAAKNNLDVSRIDCGLPSNLLVNMLSFREFPLGRRQDIVVPRNPHIKRR